MDLLGHSGEGGSGPQFAAVNVSKIRSEGCSLGLMQEEREHLFLLLHPVCFLWRECCVLFSMGEVREDRTTKQSLLMYMFSPYLMLKHSEISRRLFQHRCEASHRKHARSQIDQGVCDTITLLAQASSLGQSRIQIPVFSFWCCFAA